MIKPLTNIPPPELERERVKSFVDAEKALIDTMTKRPASHKVVARKGHHAKRTARKIMREVVPA
jgi:hypothetical protein